MADPFDLERFVAALDIFYGGKRDSKTQELVAGKDIP